MRLTIFYLLFYILNTCGFNIIPFGGSKNNLIKNKIIMYYEKGKDFEEPITILPYVQIKSIIDNWLKASIALNNKKREFLMNQFKIDQNINIDIDSDLYKNLYEFKVFMSLNRNSVNTVYFSWIPESHKGNKQVVYLIIGKILKNELFIYRIAQNPYAVDLLSINSKDLLLDLYNYHKNSKVITNINFNELHNHDNRYWLSWYFNND